jgi:hypothetical protein
LTNLISQDDAKLQFQSYTSRRRTTTEQIRRLNHAQPIPYQQRKRKGVKKEKQRRTENYDEEKAWMVM